MATSSRPPHLYVGAARAGQASRGGLFRRAGDGAWEAITRGLPERADVQAITVHPTRPDVVYLGTRTGAFRSVDAGGRWERLALGDETTQVWAVHVQPDDPRVLFAGTSPVGVWTSDDAGSTWRRRAGAVQPERVRMQSFACRVMRFATDPTHPREVYAALEVGGVMRTLDGGEHWDDCSADLLKLAERPHLRSRIDSDTEIEGMMDGHAIAASAAAPGTVIVAVRMGLFRSDDRGATWRDMEVGRFSPLTYARDVRVAPQDPRRLYACLSPAARSEDGSLWRSDDLGETWTRVDRGIKAESTTMALALDPRDPDRLACVSRTGQVFDTADGGRTWREERLPEGVRDVYALAWG
jgi:photosystem II stability/assembly factor-like uncharacterized protein